MGKGAGGPSRPMELLADTVFLIDLWREALSPGPATAYAREHGSMQVAVPWIAAGEFLSGASVAGHEPDLVAAFLSAYPILHSDAATVRCYAEIYSELRKRNIVIGPNDLWIAAVARANGLPILTRNLAGFGRITDLEIIGYGQ